MSPALTYSIRSLQGTPFRYQQTSADINIILLNLHVTNITSSFIVNRSKPLTISINTFFEGMNEGIFGSIKIMPLIMCQRGMFHGTD